MSQSAEREAFAKQIDVSRETLDKLQTYADLLIKWNKTINLIAGSTTEQIWTRHFLESIAAFQASHTTSGNWLDLGSGGGFPGAVVAIYASQHAPDIRVTCIEADIRKASFLRTVSRETGVKFGVLSRRIEETPPQNADVVSARALAPLDKLLTYAHSHLKPGGRGVFLKGETWKEEVSKALETWRFTVEKVPSPTHPTSAILIVGDLTRD